MHVQKKVMVVRLGMYCVSTNITYGKPTGAYVNRSIISGGVLLQDDICLRPPIRTQDYILKTRLN